MIFKKVYIIFLLIGGVLCSANLVAQEIDSAFIDINYVRKSNAWLSSENAAGLKHFLLPQVSSAELSFSKNDGQFKNFHQSDNSYSYSLNAISLYRLNHKVVFSGSILYDNFKGHHMGGSMFIDPYKNPFDIVEIDEANKGDKQLESYKLSGAVGAQLTSRLTIGGKLDYQAANLAKMKDLRHVNKLLDMNATFGGIYQLGKAVELGANYIYLRRIESVDFLTNGNTDRIYQSLVSFGSFYGKTERFEDSGYTDGGTIRPLTNIGHGLSLQLNLTITPNTTFFNEFSYKTKKGQYGLDGSVTFALTEHEGSHLQYTGVFSVTENDNQHQLRLDAQVEHLTNRENIYRKSTSNGGVVTSVFFGRSEVFLKDLTSANLGYTKFVNIKNNNPTWTLTADAHFFRRQQSTTIYPFYRDQNIDSYQLNTGASKNIFRSNARYTVGIEASYGAGSGTAKIDGLLAPPSSMQATPYSTDLYLQQEFEYFTKPRASANLNLQYTRVAKGNITPYAKLNYSFTKAFDTQYLGNSFAVFGAALGCNF